MPELATDSGVSSSVPPSVSSTSMIMSDLGAGDQDTSTATADDSTGTESADPALIAEVESIPEDEPIAEGADEQVVEEEQQEAQTTEAQDDEQKPDIHNLSESRWSRVHSGYKWAREVGKALGVVGEDGRVDVTLLPSVEEIKGMRAAYSDRIAMEHDFSSADPDNATTFIRNWNTFSPQGMTTVASRLPDILAQTNPQGYNAMAAPVLNRFINYMYEAGSTIEDPQVRDYVLNAARAAEWWSTGGTNGGTFRPDDKIRAARQNQPSPVEQRLAQAEGQLRNITTQEQAARWHGFVQGTDTKIMASVNAEIDTALKPLKAYYPNPVSYEAVRDKFTSLFRQTLQQDSVSDRQFRIAIEQAKRSQTAADQDALANMYLTMSRRAIAAVRGKFITEASKGIVQNSNARHAALKTSSSQVGPTSGGAPRPQSIAARPVRRSEETVSEFQQRMINADLA